MIRDPGTHGYMCECNSRTCGETLYLRHGTYLRLSRYGVLISKACSRRENRVVMGDYGAYVIAATSWSHPADEIAVDKMAVAY